MIGDFKHEHNHRHRHSALGYRTPAEYAAAVQAYPHPGGLRDQLNPEQNNPTLKTGWTQ